MKGGKYTPSRGIFGGRTFSSYRQYRNALAKQRGHATLYAQQRATNLVRDRASYARLSTPQREARDRALDALGMMRREGRSLSAATREAKTTPAAVHRYVGSELKKRGSRYEVTSSDRLFRRMYLLNKDGKFIIDVYASGPASTIGEYWSAVERYVRTGDDTALRCFRNKTIRTGKKTYEFLTDTETLDRLASFGELSFESIYES